MSFVSEIARDIQDLALPRQCVGCGALGTWLCAKCRTAGRPAPAIRRIQPDCTCAEGLSVRAAWEYSGPPRAAVLAFKERGTRALSRELARWLVPVAQRASLAGRALILIPIPARASARRRRGFDHVAVTCARLAEELRSTAGAVPAVVRPLLKWRSAGAIQKGLPAGHRARNVAGGLVIRAGQVLTGLSEGRKTQLVLVDDVLTTGATLAEAHRALCSRGVVCPQAITVGAVPAPVIHAGPVERADRYSEPVRATQE